MKTVYLSTFYPFKGGIAKFNSILTEELKKRNNEVEVFTFTTQYPLFLYGKGSQFAETKFDTDVEGKRILSTVNPFSWFKTARKIKKIQPDLLIMKYWVTQLAPSLGTVIRLLSDKIKKVIILDNIIPHEPKLYDRWLNKYILRKNNFYIAMSHKVKSDLLSIQPQAKVKVIQHPLYDYGKKLDKIFARQNLEIATDKKTLLFFGLIRDYKGLDILIKTFSELDNSYQLLIAGECREKIEFYENLIANSNNKNIKFVNKFIADDEVNLYFSAADLCILPYRSATQSGITAISFHFELPMLATDVGGLAEIIKNGETGLIVQNPSEKDLKNGILDYFEKADIINLKQNIVKVKEKLTWEYFAEELLDFVEKKINN